MSRWRWLLSTALAASAVSGVATVQAQEEPENAQPVSIDEIPAPARRSIRTEVGPGMLLEVDEATWQNGEPAYEGHIKKGRRDIIIWVDAGGNILLKH